MKDTLWNLQRLTDEMGEEMRRLAVQSGATCSSRCHGCCYNLFTISFVEGIQVAKWMIDQKKNTPGMRKRLRDSVMCMIDPKTGTWKSPKSYFNEKRPCAFLTDSSRGKKCSIYPGRPLTCRSYFVRTPPERCHPEFKGSRNILTFDVSRWKEQASEIARITEVEIGLPEELRVGLCGPIPAMVLTALGYLEGGPDALKGFLK